MSDYLLRSLNKLKELEYIWCDYDEIWHRAAGYYCDECGGHRDAGHRLGCELGDLIKDL